MEVKPGDVVILKSGGHPLSVVEVSESTAACVWMGNEGALLRETLPLAVLELAEGESSGDEEDAEDEDENEDEDEEEEEEEEADEEDEPKKKKK